MEFPGRKIFLNGVVYATGLKVLGIKNAIFKILYHLF